MPTDIPQGAHAMLDALFGHAPVGLGMWDTELRFARINAALAEINGATQDEHLGRRPSEVLGELGVGVEAALAEVVRTREPVRGLEVAGETPAQPGVTRHFRVDYYPVPREDGSLLGVAAVVADVSADHATEEERDRLIRDALSARAQAEAAQVRAETLRRDAEDARRRATFLAEAGRRLAAVALDYEGTLREVAGIAVPSVADWCLFGLLEPGGVLRPAATGALPELADLVRDIAVRFPQTADAPGVDDVLRTGEPLLVEDFDESMRERFARGSEHLQILRDMQVRSAMLVPLTVAGRRIGALSFVVCGERTYGPDDLTLARSLAVRAALAVENARLMRERSHIAETLQRSLEAGPLPVVPGLELAARYRAAGDENQVGGDFYDAFPAEDGVWAVAVGDVTGKGAEAAALTSLTRHTLRAGALRGASAADNLALLNAALWSHGDTQGRFASVVYVRVCPRGEGTALTLASGGHPPPLLLRADGTVEEVETRGTLVGALPGSAFEEQTLDLAPGDLLLLYTDGVTEVRRSDGDFGERALRDVLAAQRGAPAEQVVAAVEASAVELQGGVPRDDIAIVAIRARP